MSVDHIAVQHDGGEKCLTVSEWRALGLSERVLCIRERRVRFLRGEAEVPVKQALAWIKQGKE